MAYLISISPAEFMHFVRQNFTSNSLSIANGFSVQAAKGYTFKPIFQDHLSPYILDNAGSAIIGCCQFFMYGNKHMQHLD